ncbi:MAG: COP23 domain-containing protein [Cyanobacteria bacterium J06621_12]
MSRPNYLAAIATTSLITFAGSVYQVQPGQAASLVNITCQQQASVPTVMATLSNQDVSQVTPLLSFLPQYFEATQASQYCQSAADKLQTYYSQNRMNYLASDTIAGKPVVCAVERRGLSCDSYNSDILFSLNQTVSPTELLYNMLGNDFKGSKAPSSRTVSRIYTDLRPLWWPF